MVSPPNRRDKSGAQRGCLGCLGCFGLLLGLGIAVLAIGFLSPVLIIGAVALLILAWKKPEVVTRMADSPLLARLPAWTRATPMTFAVLAAVAIVPVSTVFGAMTYGPNGILRATPTPAINARATETRAVEIAERSALTVTPLPASTVVTPLVIPSPIPSPTPMSAYKWQLTVQTVERVELSNTVAGNGYTWLLLRTKVTNGGTGSASVQEQDFNLSADGQAIRAHKDGVEEMAQRTNDKGFGRIAGTSIRAGASETRILVFLVPTQAKKLTLHLNKDEQSTADLAIPIDLAERVAQASTVPMATLVPPTPTNTPPPPTPTPTPRPPTSTPTPRPEPTPTSAAIASEQGYRSQIVRQTETMGASFRRFGTLASDPKLLDPDWRRRVAIELGTWKATYAQAQQMTPPERFVPVHEKYLAALAQFDSAADDTAYGLDNPGTAAGNARLSSAQSKIAEGNRLLGEVVALMQEIR